MDNNGKILGNNNDISSIKVIDKHFDYTTMEAAVNIWVTELHSDNIRAYRKLKGQKGKLFKDKVIVPEDRMIEFFHQVYEFVRLHYSSINSLSPC